MLVAWKTLSSYVTSTINKRYNIAQFKENVFTVSLKRFVDCLKNSIQLRFVNVSNLVPKTLYERN